MSESSVSTGQRAQAAAGKDTRGSIQLPAGGVHPAPVPVVPPAGYPHLPYGDAIHRALTEAGLAPDLMEAGLRTGPRPAQRELFLRLVWPAGHTAPGRPARPCTLTLDWQPMTGWTAQAGDHTTHLAVGDLAAPGLLVDAVRHTTEHGTAAPWPAPADTRWDHARALDAALAQFDAEEATR